MSLNCDPSALAEASKCYCYDSKTAEQVKIYLLANIAGLEGMTPAQLAAAAKCYCYDQKTMAAVNIYLACLGATNAGG